MSQLVKKISTAVAITESLSTLLDWVYIGHLSGFTIIVENTAGGTANDITDVQVDESDDAGVTPSLDQHAATPAVPITGGNCTQKTFTSTAKWIRVRAICAEGEDTTAKAWLLADSSAAKICTLADVKDRLAETTTDHDVTIAQIIAGVEAIFNSYTQRTLIAPAADTTEYYTGCSKKLLLKNYPLISITSITEASRYDFDDQTALVADSGYRLIGGGKNGIIYRMYQNWLGIEDSIEIVYRAGYAAAGVELGDNEAALPADIKEAAIEQTCFIFKRKDDIGLSSVGFNGGSVSKFSAMDLLRYGKQCRQVLRCRFGRPGRRRQDNRRCRSS